MKITMNADALAAALKHGIAAPNSPLPVLQHVRISMDREPGIATLETTTTDIWVCARVQAHGDAEFDILLRDDLLRAAAVPGAGEVTIGDDGKVRTGRGKYSTPAMDAAEFPSAEDADWQPVACDVDTLRQALSVVGYAGDGQDVVSLGKSVNVVPGMVWATDGKSMASMAVDFDGPALAIPTGHVQRVVDALTQPNATVQVALQSSGAARLLRVSGDLLSISMRLLAVPNLDMGSYIDRVELGADTLRLRTAPLQQALRRMLPFVRFAVGGKRSKTGYDEVHLTSNADGLALHDLSGEFRESVSEALEEGESAGEWSIAFDCRRVAAALAANGADTVTVHPRCKGPNGAPIVAIVPQGLTMRQAVHLASQITH